MNKSEFVIGLGKILSSIAIPGNINNGLDLEEILLPHVKSYVQESLQKTQEELKTIVYAHGKNKEEKKLWSESKKSRLLRLLTAQWPLIYSFIMKTSERYLLKSNWQNQKNQAVILSQAVSNVQ
jgi:hypothetical protein